MYVDLTWIEIVYFEVQTGKQKSTHSILALGLQECQTYGRLSAFGCIGKITEQRNLKVLMQRKAYRHDPDVVFEVAKYVSKTGKIGGCLNMDVTGYFPRR